jgi:NDP-sugar pyrophosphorylase family protein
MKVSSVFDTSDRGNAWWIFNTLMRHLDEPTFVLTSDNLFEIDFEALAADYFGKGAPPLMVVPVKPVEGLDGDFIHDRDGVVTKLDRHDPAPYYCSGIQILNPSKINALVPPTENFYEVWGPLIAQQQLCVSKVLPQKWVALDTLEQLKNIGDYYK